MGKHTFFTFSPEKNAELKTERGVTFEDVIYCIHHDKVLDIVYHYNTKKYPDQLIMIVEIDGCAYQVPFKYEDENIRLITVFPSRKCTKQYLGGE